MTKLLLTKIPFFREIVVMSFHCEHCGFQNSEIQSAGEIQQRGVKYSFRIDTTADLSRQLVKSDTCIFRVEDIDLEVPPGRGQMTNVEGILTTIAQDLEEKQPERKTAMPAMFEQLEAIIKQLKEMTEGTKVPFTISINDSAGNSWVEPSPSDSHGKLIKSEYARTSEQNVALGLSADTEEPNPEAGDQVQMRPAYHPEHMGLPAESAVNNVDDNDIIENEVYTFPAKCPGCMRPCATNMKMVNIPHFNKVVIMSTVCDECGYRSNEVKTGGEVPEKGRRITVTVSKLEDLSRDILKSETCSLSSPELSLSVEPGTMGGRFTTIEGLLTQVRDDLKASVFDADAQGGDSMPTDDTKKWEDFFDKLDRTIKGELLPFTILLEDPLAGSYVQSLAEIDGELDDRLTKEDYERTQEELESLGLLDMKTEGYGQNEEEVKPHES
jgi:zinc finger protein